MGRPGGSGVSPAGVPKYYIFKTGSCKIPIAGTGTDFLDNDLIMKKKKNK